MDVSRFLAEASVDEIVDTIVELSVSQDESSFDELRDLLLVRDDNIFDKHAIPQLVSRALLQKGVKGTQVLMAAVREAPGAIYPMTILEALWHAGRGEQPPTLTLGRMIPKPPLDGRLSPETIVAAREVFHDLVVESQDNEDLFDRLMQFLHRATFHLNTPGKGHLFRPEVFEVFSEATIRLTRQLISTFERLIGEERSEEVYQRFLTDNPVLIDPLATEIVPKQKLGIELITDFVVRRLDNEYIVVEIEKPQDQLFTASCDFTSQFSHAIGQIIDFQEWVDQHGEYARSLMPGISSPRGLLLMGRRPALSARAVSKLKRYCINLNTVEIFTYDDLLARAKHFYDNINRSIKSEGSVCDPRRKPN